MGHRILWRLSNWNGRPAWTPRNAAYQAGLNRAVLATRKAAADIKALEFNAQWKIDVIFSSSGGKYGPAGYGSEGESDFAGGKPQGGGAEFQAKDTGGKGGGGPGLMEEWKNELDQIKMAENQYLDFSKQAEKEFWQSKLEECSEGSKEYLAVQKELYNVNKALAKNAVQDQIADLDRQMTSEKTNWMPRKP